jgi:hypothetical protein
MNESSQPATQARNKQAPQRRHSRRPPRHGVRGRLRRGTTVRVQLHGVVVDHLLILGERYPDLTLVALVRGAIARSAEQALAELIERDAAQLEREAYGFGST